MGILVRSFAASPTQEERRKDEGQKQNEISSNKTLKEGKNLDHTKYTSRRQGQSVPPMAASPP